MSSFSRLIRFECEEDNNKPYFANLGLDSDGLPSPGTKLGVFKSFDYLTNKREENTVALRRPCCGSRSRNYPDLMSSQVRTHLENEQLPIPSYPPLWSKPVASVAHPFERIPANDLCAKSLLDYEVSNGAKPPITVTQ
ncbi:fumarylacetoacetate hydrolase family protein [Ilyonectria robusta]